MLSLRYYEVIKEETSIEKEGSVIIESGPIPVKMNVRKYERGGETNYIAYFSSKGKWTARLHFEPEELELIIRKLRERK